MKIVVFALLIGLPFAWGLSVFLSNTQVEIALYEKNSVEYVFFRLNKFRQSSILKEDVDWALDEIRWNASLSLLAYGELWCLMKINPMVRDRVKKIPRGNELIAVIENRGELCYAEWYCNGNTVFEK